MIATGDWSGQIAFWSAKTGQRLSELLPGHTSWVEEVAFSPDGKILASNGMDGMIIFWDVATQRKLSLGIDASSKGEYLAFSHDSHALFSDGRGGIVRWSLDYASMRDQACQIANRNLTQSEWDLYIGSNLSYQRTCPEIPLNDFDLQAMMLSDAELGQIAAGLDIAYLESGLMLNERFVRDSVDLSNSPDPIYQLGRLTGYRSDYHIPEYYTAVSNNYAGFLRVGTAISLFQDPQSVQLFKNHTFDQLERFNQGDPNLRCCLLDWEEISLDGIADDTWGILMRFDNPSNELIVTRTYISIQIGNLLGEVNIYRSDEVDDMPEVQRIARVLERKILQVLQNESDPRFMLLNPLSYGVNTP
jgi:WD40 repeat protein